MKSLFIWFPHFDVDNWAEGLGPVCEWLLSHLHLYLYMEINLHKTSHPCPGDVLSEEEVMMLIKAADKDGDGTLDFEEFVKIMMWRQL